MDKLEKVIKGIQCCKPTWFDACKCNSQCPYDSYGHNPGGCFDRLCEDALSLLKAQGPVKPYIDYDGQDVWRCRSCGATLFHLSHTQADENEQNCVKFCRHCGQAVKWE